MLDKKFVRENPEQVRLNTKNKNAEADIDRFIELDTIRRETITSVEQLKNQRNTVSFEIARKKKNKEDADDLIRHMREVSQTIKELDDKQRVTEAEMDAIALSIPNMLHESVPIGDEKEANTELRRWGECVAKEFRKDHLSISKELGIYDFERGAKISGSGFPVYLGKGARLERALINFFLDFNRENHGYTEVMTPVLANTRTMRGTGQLPKFEEDMYKCRDDDLYLIPTAEVSITNLHADEILNAEELPVKYCGYSASFRREAGSYGKETRGFMRVHQFNKVELVKFTRPEESYNELETLVADVERLLRALEVPYRVVLLGSGDTTFASAKTIDFEVWTPVEQRWLEVSSCSNFENFQARRANIRFKRDQQAKPEFVHTLNGSGLATPRLLVSLLENNQTEDGHITIPEPLQPYCGFDRI